MYIYIYIYTWIVFYEVGGTLFARNVCLEWRVFPKWPWFGTKEWAALGRMRNAAASWKNDLRCSYEAPWKNWKRNEKNNIDKHCHNLSHAICHDLWQWTWSMDINLGADMATKNFANCYKYCRVLKNIKDVLLYWALLNEAVGDL